ncbi:MAG TPA: Nif3-like dinuclear metal center hexameric protein [Chitinophagaceae bacterium]|nr:Nif3-like dinuclear metal center hexameric protein [Chitinophagaceae bacterium]
MNTKQRYTTQRCDTLERRKFVTTLLTAVGGTALSLLPGTGLAASFLNVPVSVQQVIDLILKRVPGAPFAQTVDTIKAGEANQQVTGIVTTMFATAAVIEKAAALGANFIIAHEPTFYNHTDETTGLQHDPVYAYKAALLKKHNMVVWRFHDALHAHRPDGVQQGVLAALGWEKYYDAANPRSIILPPTTFQNIITLVKARLYIPHVKYVGNLQDRCSKILLIPGAAGGPMQIANLAKEKPDLLIVGEVNEWETSEYVRDSRHMGTKTNLLVLGHVQSEEPGLEWLAKWLQPQLDGIKITHVPSGDAFDWA